MRHVFIISDLHLGGRPDERDDSGRITRTGFQFCNAYAQLTDFVDWLHTSARDEQGGSLELVINGDIVDFLAEDDFGWAGAGAQVWTADEKKAIAKLKHIASRTRDSGGRGIFEALKDYLAAGNQLTLLLGNHDVELALPSVRQCLSDLVGGQNSQFRFVYDGEAYAIGRLLVEHGNRYDPWNIINHSALRQERSVRSRGLSVDEGRRAERFFVAPAGTSIVVHFMNRIKSRYRFIDLLKPETNAVLPLLLALEPDRRPELEEIIEVIRIAKSYRRHGLEAPTMPLVPGDMANPRVTPHDVLTLNDILRQTLGEDADLFAGPPTAKIAGDMGLRRTLLGITDWMASRYEQFKELASSASAIYRLRGLAESEEHYRRLHVALRRLNRNDRTFDVATEDPAYLSAAMETTGSGAYDVVVYGHTHLPKKILVGEGQCGPKWYFNTGTWCDVMQLPESFARDYAEAGGEVKEFVESLRKNDFGRYVKRYLSFFEAKINSDGTVAGADLYSFCGRGRERERPLTDWLAGRGAS
jgi:UDP-2,3-diacylglucosamine pyrophosphatase LpxH